MAKTTKAKKSKPAKNAMDPTIEQILTEIRKKRDDNEARGREQLNVICPELFLMGVSSCCAMYDGEGDSGSIVHIIFYNAKQEPIPIRNAKQEPIPISAALSKYRDALIDALYDLLPSGFEINDGSYGEITIDIAKKEVKIEQNVREISTEYYETIFKY